MPRIKRHENEIRIWDDVGGAPMILTKEQAVELAQELLDKAGQIKEEIEE